MRNSRRMVFTNSQSARTFSRLKLYAAVLAASQCIATGQVWAAPEGGEVVGGEGIIQQAGVETIITQATERMAIDWRSFDVAANERVEFIQPGSSSVALNRVLSNRGSEILGRIDANGQVILVNANGVVFGKDSVVNVGGMIASGLSINPSSFINGDFALSSIEGAEGKVINYGIINAATGGSVTLIGKQVQNNGLISAKLGAVNLVAGKAAVLTFDPTGMVGIKITEAVVQDELGVDAAVINSGSINAEGGRVLLSASVSEDVFSDAVNNAGINKVSSVVVHDDGSFTLGAGADVINTGDISTSVTEGNAGQVVILGDNITLSGSISANTSAGAGGSIELHSTDTTLLTENSTVSAQAITKGQGGDIKILGNKVGLFDQTEVNASGANGGGQVLIGGDKTGQNQRVRNADFIYLGEKTNVKADALIEGNGGKLITFASDTTRIYGNLYSRGGNDGGNGGFIETSGLKGFEILNTPDITASAGIGGTWLIDPYNIAIGLGQNNTPSSDGGKTFTSNENGAQLSTANIKTALTNGSTVIVQTGGSASDGDTTDTDVGNITLNADLNFDFSNNATLRLLAHNNIVLNSNIQRASNSVTGTLNIELIANKDNLNGGDITLANGVTVATNGGYFYAGKSESILGNGQFADKVVNFTSTDATIRTWGALGGGDIVINAAGNVDLGSVDFKYNYENANSNNGNNTANLVRVGSVTVNSGGNVTLHKEIDFNDTGRRQEDGDKGYAGTLLDGKETFLTIQAFGDITIKEKIRDKDWGDSRDSLNIDLTAGKNNTSGTINIDADIYTAGGNFTATSFNFDSTGFSINTDRANERNTVAIGGENGDARWSNGGDVTISARDTIKLGSITTDGSCSTPSNSACTGNLSLSGIDTDAGLAGIQPSAVVITQATGSALNVAGNAIFNTGSGSIDLENTQNLFAKDLIFTSAGTVSILDSSAVNLGASNIAGNFNLTTGGNISQTGAINVTGDTTFDAISTESNYGVNLIWANDFGGKVKATKASSIKLTGVNDLSLDAITLVGGPTGDIDLTAGVTNKIILNGNLNSSAGTTTKNITFNNNVEVASNTIINAGTGTINFNGTIDSNDATAKNLTLTGGNISFTGDMGKLHALGDLELTSSALVTIGAVDIKASSFNITGAGTATDSLTLTNGKNNWVLTDTNKGSVQKLDGDDDPLSPVIEFSGIQNIKGGTGADRFEIGALGTITSIDGDTGNNTLVGRNEINTWEIDGINRGVLKQISTTYVNQFTSIQNLIGGSLNDTFDFSVATSAAITGSINGGAGEGAGVLNSLKGRNTTSTWVITGADAGSINVTASGNYLNKFENIQNLAGGSAADVFDFSTAATASISGKVDGGASAEGNEIKARAAVSVKNTWAMTDHEAGNLAQTDGPRDVYINQFSAIRVFTGAGSDTMSYAGIDAGPIVVTLGAAGVTGVTDFVGSVFVDSTLVGENKVNTWLIDGANSGSINAGAITFSDFNNLTGGNLADTFDFTSTNNVGDISGRIDGGSTGESNAIKARAGMGVKNTWSMSGNGAGQLSQTDATQDIYVNQFTNIQIFTGAGTDTMSYANVATGTVTVNLETAGVTGVTDFVGSTLVDSTLVGENKDNDWTIEGVNSGKINANTASEVTFSNFNYLIGGNQVDTFIFFDAGRIKGGSGSAGNDIVNLSNLTTDETIIFTDTTVKGISSIARVIGSTTQNHTLQAMSGPNTWRIYDVDNDALSTVISDGINDGHINNGPDTLQFINFSNLQGGSGNDIFNIETNFTGTIKGGGGDNTFNIKALVNNIEGEAGNDQFIFFDSGGVTTASGGDGDDIVDLRNLTRAQVITFTGTTVNGVSSVARVIGSTTPSHILQATSGDNTWRIFNIDNNGEITNSDGVLQFVNFSNLHGGSGDDIFNIETNFTGTIKGGGGDDIFNIKALVNNIEGEAGNDQFIFFDSGGVTTASGGDGDDIVDLSNLTIAQTIKFTGTTVKGVSSIARVIGSTTQSHTLQATSGTNTWRIYDVDNDALLTVISDGINDGHINNGPDTLQFINFSNLQGGSGDDIFNIETNFTGTIKGGGGDNIFNIKALVNNIEGEAGNDQFIFFDSGGVTTASGGDGDDIVDLRNLTRAQVITFTGTTVNGVSSVARVIGSTTPSHILQATSGDNTWRIFNIDNNGEITNSAGALQFVNFSNLHGGSGDDIFNIETNFTGTIKGGGGDDIFNIKALVNNIEGEAGNDQFIFFDSGGVTTASGGDGDDIVDLRNLTRSQVITFTGTTVNGVNSVARVIGSTIQNHTLQAASDTNDWIINGENDGHVAGIDFIDFKTLMGGAGADTFTFIGQSSSIVTIDGGGGTNTINGRNQDTIWTMMGTNSGSIATTNAGVYVNSFIGVSNLVGGSAIDTLAASNQRNSWTIDNTNAGILYATATPTEKIQFSGIENLVGNQDVDLFSFTVNGNITGLIDGGTSATQNIIKDSLDLSELTGNITVELGSQHTSALNVVNIEEIIAATANQDNHVLQGASDVAYRWIITGQNEGLIERATAPSLETSVSFVNFGDLRGGTNNDRFDMQGTITKSIDGGAGIDLVDYSQRKENVVITLGGNGGFGNTGINGIEGVVGNSGNGNGFTSTIRVETGNNNWEIGSADFGDGINDGSIIVNNSKVIFENFTHLIGGSGRDTFTYTANGLWIGSIDGGDGINNIDASRSTRDQQFFLNGTALNSGTNFKNINELNANANTRSKLISSLQANTWKIDAQGKGRLNSSLEFSNFTSLQGGNFADTFDIANLISLKDIDGGGGDSVDTVNLVVIDKAIQVAVDLQTEADIKLLNIEVINANSNFENTLKGDLNGNEWKINGLNSGLLNNKTNFTGFANLLGSAKSDSVVFAGNTAMLTGHLDLGGGQDTLDLSASNRDMTVQINSSRNALAAGVLSIDNIEVIYGGADQSNRLIADNFTNTWILNDINAGRLSNVEKGSLAFTQFKHITGGNQDDIFVFEALGNITGLVDGGGQLARDIVDLSKSNNTNVVIATTGEGLGFTNVEKYIGNNIDSTLTAANIANTWLLSGVNRGTLNETVEFENFGVLKGGNKQDNFIIHNATISGSIDAGDGDDIFSIQASAIAGKIFGGNGDDRFTFIVTSDAEGIADIDGGDGADRLTVEGGDNGYKVSHQLGRHEYLGANNNAYSITYSGITNIFDNVIAESLSIFGTATADTFRLQAGRYNTNNIATINYSNKSNLIVNGLADDQVIVDGTVTIDSAVTFNNVRVLAENSGKIQAKSLVLANTGAVGSASARLNTAINDLSLSATKGAIYLEEQDTLQLKSFNVSTTDLVDIRAGGNISNTHALTYSGNLNIESLRGNVDLGSANALTGILTLKAAGSIVIDNLQTLLLGDLVAQNATLSSGASIKGNGVFSVAGLSLLRAGSDISLVNAGNDINQISVANANNVDLFDINGFTTTGLNVANNLSLRSLGGITLGASCTTDCVSSYAINAKNINVQSDTTITVAKNIMATDAVALESQGIVVNDAITAKQFSLNARNGKLLLNEGGNLLGQGGSSIELGANTIEQRSAITSGGNVKITTTGDFNMTNTALIESLAEDISLQGNNLGLSSLRAVNGAVVMNAQGSIQDANGEAINIIASRWEADAISGIGVGMGEGNGADAIETDVDVLSVRNAGKLHSVSSINIANSGSLMIEQLRNNGNISLSNSGDIVLDNTNNAKFDLADIDARTQGGVINANTGLNGGQLLLTITNGMVRGQNKAAADNPDIIADISTFNFKSSFDFGERNRKIVMHIPEVYNQNARLSFVKWYKFKPKVMNDLSKVPNESVISGRDQLIQIEGLSEIDPAIFTNLRNYVHDEVAILLPVDQRFEDETENF